MQITEARASAGTADITWGAESARVETYLGNPIPKMRVNGDTRTVVYPSDPPPNSAVDIFGAVITGSGTTEERITPPPPPPPPIGPFEYSPNIASVGAENWIPYQEKSSPSILQLARAPSGLVGSKTITPLYSPFTHSGGPQISASDICSDIAIAYHGGATAGTSVPVAMVLDTSANILVNGTALDASAQAGVVALSDVPGKCGWVAGYKRTDGLGLTYFERVGSTLQKTNHLAVADPGALAPAIQGITDATSMLFFQETGVGGGLKSALVNHMTGAAIKTASVADPGTYNYLRLAANADGTSWACYQDVTAGKIFCQGLTRFGDTLGPLEEVPFIGPVGTLAAAADKAATDKLAVLAVDGTEFRTLLGTVSCIYPNVPEQTSFAYGENVPKSLPQTYFGCGSFPITATLDATAGSLTAPGCTYMEAASIGTLSCPSYSGPFDMVFTPTTGSVANVDVTVSAGQAPTTYQTVLSLSGVAGPPGPPPPPSPPSLPAAVSSPSGDRNWTAVGVGSSFGLAVLVGAVMYLVRLCGADEPGKRIRNDLRNVAWYGGNIFTCCILGYKWDREDFSRLVPELSKQEINMRKMKDSVEHMTGHNAEGDMELVAVTTGNPPMDQGGASAGENDNFV